MTDISKTFGQSKVLENVTFRVRKGSVHGLVGHNGAGKSTLMKIALGGVAPTRGTVTIAETQLSFSRPAEARAAGVGMVLQELSLIPTLSVVDNIFLNAERTTAVKTINARSERREAQSLLRELGITGVSSSQMISELSIAEQQMIEIAKAFRLGRRLLILDEPTAPLSRREVMRLFELVRRASSLGTGIVFITHHLREVFEICDEITVLREGRTVLTRPSDQTTLKEVVSAIVGRELSIAELPESKQVIGVGKSILAVKDLAVKGKLSDITFTLGQGEIVGVAGLAGSGRSTLLRALMGVVQPDRGSVLIRGKRYRPGSPAGAIKRGVYLVPEDRHVHGVILTHTIEQNMVLPVLGRVSRLFLYLPWVARVAVDRMLKALDVKTTGRHQVMQELSGGNQQKVVFAKAFLSQPTVFLLDEPTFGVDVHTAADVIHRMRDEVQAGAAVLWVSSDLQELLTVSDRVLVLADGTIRRVVSRGDAGFNEEAMLQAIQRAGAAPAAEPPTG